MACHQEYVMEALSGKTVLLVTHQVDFLPAFNSILVGISLKQQQFSLSSFLVCSYLFVSRL
jgi:ABC-type transport system involved in cytochrome bd biosynthesis fused ATPase/permease subunit